MNWFRQIFTRHQMYSDLNEEVRQHLQMKIEELMAGGMPSQEAEQTARRAFGNLTLLEERSREVWQWPTAESIWADIRFAARQLRKSPGFTITAVLTLALGIGANTAIFSVVDKVLLHPVPYQDPDRLVTVTESEPLQQQAADNFGVSAGEYIDYRDRNQSFSQVAAYESGGFNLTGIGQPLRVNAARVSASTFSLLGASPERGRTFTAEEERFGSDRVVLLSHALWQRQYNSDPSIVGKTIRLDETPYLVIGLMPASFRFPFDGAPFSELADVWVPESFQPYRLKPENRTMEFGVGMIGRLKPGVSREQAQLDVEHIAANFMRQYPQAYAGNLRIAPETFAFSAFVTRKAKILVVLLASAVFCVLLIACANVANLLLARATHRSHEMAIRGAIGAQRLRLLRQCLVESALLSLLGSCSGVLLALALLIGLKHFGPASVPGLHEANLHPVILLFTLGLSLLTSVVFGFVPAWRLSHVAPQACLKERTSAGSANPSQRLQSSLIAGEIAIALVLLLSGGLLLRSFLQLVSSPFGFNPDGSFVVRTLFDRTRYPVPEKRRLVQKTLLEQLTHIPGVTAVALASHLPLSEERQIGFRLERSAPNDSHWADNSLISPNYFHAMGVTLLRGRDFNEQDRTGSVPVAIVNETLAREYFPGEDPLGQRFQWGDRDIFTIIGVAADVHITALDADPQPMIYHDMFQVESGASGRTAIVLRSMQSNQILFSEVQRRIWSLDKDLPLYHTTTLATLVSESLSQRRFTMILLCSFAGIALLLAGIGLFGVVSYLVAERRAEFGLRMALGANRRHIYLLVLRKGCLLGLLGCGIGLLCSMFVERLLASSLYHVHRYDPITLTAVPALLLSVVLFAAFWPARRAASIDPMQTLRAE